MTGKDGVKIDGANTIHFSKHQVKKKTNIEFSIKKLPFLKPAVQSLLLIIFTWKRERGFQFSADQQYIITGISKSPANAVHALIIVEIICYGKNYFLHPPQI